MQFISNLYSSPDLRGDSLTQPLKSYNGFFAQKVEDSSNTVQKLAWRIAQIVIGILVYPVLGTLASIGLLVKLTDVSNLKAHNEAEKRTIRSVGATLQDIFRRTYVDPEQIRKRLRNQSGQDLEIHKVMETAEYQLSASGRLKCFFCPDSFGATYGYSMNFSDAPPKSELEPVTTTLTLDDYADKISEMVKSIDEATERYVKVYHRVQSQGKDVSYKVELVLLRRSC